MQRISSHVLDTTLGKPAAGIDIVLFKHKGDEWIEISQGTTDNDGRVGNFLNDKLALETARYRLRFSLEAYFALQQQPCFYPQVEIECQLQAEDDHYHIPLLISPFGYSTYRGS